MGVLLLSFIDCRLGHRGALGAGVTDEADQPEQNIATHRCSGFFCLNFIQL